ncbi:hypothetical protein chiPu_0026942, partial [Chiloscyllium punctatum]|nr:hypothetical protein [Chiloscyllium punctatum]
MVNRVRGWTARVRSGSCEKNMHLSLQTRVITESSKCLLYFQLFSFVFNNSPGPFCLVCFLH